MDVLGGQFGIVVTNNLTERDLLVDQFQDVLYRDAGARNTRLPEVNPCVNRYPIHQMLSAFVQQFAHLASNPFATSGHSNTSYGRR